MKLYLLIFLFSSMYPYVPDIPPIPYLDDSNRQKVLDSLIPDDFTVGQKARLRQEEARISQSISQSKPTIILPTMTVKFDIIVDGDSIIYSCPVFTLDGQVVACSVCGMPPCQIEVNNGKLKCLCFNHIPKRRGSFLD